MECVNRAKGPTLGPVRSFSVDRRREKEEYRARRKHPTKLVKAPPDDSGLDIEEELFMDGAILFFDPQPMGEASLHSCSNCQVRLICLFLFASLI